MRELETLEFKIAGGAAAQTLGLLNAIYVSKKTMRPFRVKYFPHSTGTYWPFAIGFLLKEGELADDRAFIKGFAPTSDLPIGKIISDHPLEKDYFSRERLLKWIRALGIEYFLRKLRREISVEAHPSRLEEISRRIKSVSGGYAPLLNNEVMRELDSRFRVGLNNKSPFARDSKIREEYAVLHYRIGDKRANFRHGKDFGGDGIFDPGCFKKILSKVQLPKSAKLYVVSDEPLVAQNLLRESGIAAHLFRGINDIWQDLFHMSQAKILIGSWSQVSQLAAICVSHNGGYALLPNSPLSGTRVHWKIPGTDFFQPRYLKSEHPIYASDFAHSKQNHKEHGLNPSP